ncbi:hypothetical protein H9M94_00940 [Mycoplasma sp. Pen4]|uniref:aromatic motif membrane protein n=1 Tax=Mycoplasma sp. Pen4 TaxID=640330 RepID=UPI001654BBE7|nr:aromatic motif membrane protein [Mycoplasma sp. Pen4]QNM93826.1 hypothetical protein H9M94_00940 [Mycoplasma sp. Pen4]
MIKKLLLLCTSAIGTTFPIIATSCANYTAKDEFNNLIERDKIISLDTTSQTKKIHNDIIEKILNLVYKNNTEEKQKYLIAQKENKDQILKEFQEITKEYHEKYSKIDDYIKEINDIRNIWWAFSSAEKVEKNKRIQFLNEQIALLKQEQTMPAIEYVKQYRDFFYKNWYFILNNLNLFQFTFIDWVRNPIFTSSKLSDDYLNRLKELKPYPVLRFADTYIDEMKIGDESSELSNSDIYYLRKGKLVFRIQITYSTEIPVVKLEPINIYFGGSITNNISLNLLSSSIHSGFIHDYEVGLIQFERDMVNKLGYKEPTFVFPFVEIKKGEANGN